jgi:hypothetical protein
MGWGSGLDDPFDRALVGLAQQLKMTQRNARHGKPTAFSDQGLLGPMELAELLSQSE